VLSARSVPRRSKEDNWGNQVSSVGESVKKRVPHTRDNILMNNFKMMHIVLSTGVYKPVFSHIQHNL
jgi:hypothetical protein